MPVIIEMFPPEAMALQEEVKQHPALCNALAGLGSESTLNERIAIIAAYCGMLLDGYYREDELAELFKIMLYKLKNRSKILVH